MIKNDELFLYKQTNQKNELFKSVKEKYNLSPSSKNLRTFFVRKLNSDEQLIKTINKEVDNFFNMPDNYFEFNSFITVGKKIKIKEVRPDIRKCTKRMKTVKKVGLTNSNSRNIDNLSYQNRKQQQDLPYNNTNFEIIDNNQLKDIFQSFKESNEIYKKSQYINDEKSLFRLPSGISNILTEQNKKLTKKIKLDKQQRILSKYFSQKVNKKEKDLLFNRVDSFRYKKELSNQIKNNKSPEDKYERFKWYISLRRPENFKGIRRTYINLRKNNNPFWGIIIEKSPKQTEFNVKPGYDLNNKDFGDYIENKEKTIRNQDSFKILENLDKININGKNLYDVEYKREMSNKNKKILHKAFIENGKVILNSELNNIFGNETIYKNYKNSNLKTEPNRCTKMNGSYSSF